MNNMCKVVINKESFNKKELLEELCKKYGYDIFYLEDNNIEYEGYFQNNFKFDNIDNALINLIPDLENFEEEDDSEEFLDRIKRELDFIKGLKEEKENNKNNSEVKNMKKSDLKDMMVLESRYGARFLYIHPYAIGYNSRLFLDDYDDNFNIIGEYNENLEILKIYQPKVFDGFNNIVKDDKLELIWEREEKIYVDFMEIMRLFKESEVKTIYCELQHTLFKYEGSNINPLKGLKEKNTKEGLSLEEILEGKWYYLK